LHVAWNWLNWIWKEKGHLLPSIVLYHPPHHLQGSLW
jgi:hypothetical protein